MIRTALVSRVFRFALAASVVLPTAIHAAPAVEAVAASPAEIDARVRDLLRRMTLDEKVGQLVQYSLPWRLTGPGSINDLEHVITEGGVGSLLNVTGTDEVRRWQKMAVESSRLHIPLLFGLDVIHGFRTIFPIPLASAASWDIPRIEHAERIAATEAAASGVNWTFAPMVDIARDPRWGRMSEGAGEDPYLGSLVAAARVRGFQGNLGSTDAILACAKHFAGYGAVQAGREYYTTDMSDRTLREIYLPPFHAAVNAGVATFMAGFNDLNGTPCTENEFLLRHVLRDDWGFKGFVVSDWAAISELQLHGVATDLRDAAREAFLAGVDMDMQSEAYGKDLAELVRSGKVPQSRLDKSVSAVLASKFRLGLFDDPYRFCDEAREKATLLRPDFLDAARDLARRSCVLLKNDHELLPLPTKGITVGLIGPMADAPLDQLGAWHGNGDWEDTVTVKSALEKIYPGLRLRYAPGSAMTGTLDAGFARARRVADDSDVVVAALGEGALQSGEAASRASLELSGPQIQLLEAVHAAGKPIVLLLMTGRPLTIENILPLVDAVVVAWHPGTMGGPAIADVLTGAYDPSGHLTVTWPRSIGQIPIFYAHKNSGRPEPIKYDDRYYSHYLDELNTPQYPFGFGLSYTRFRFSKLRLSATSMTFGGPPLVATVRIRNTGSRPGQETVQLYVHDLIGSVTRPVRELKGFQLIDLQPGEIRDVKFSLTPADLAFWRADMTYGPEPGAFELYIGDDSDAPLRGRFMLEPRETGASPGPQ